jgi:hypothetical protein
LNTTERTRAISNRKHRAQRDAKDRTHGIYCNGQWKEFEVWRVPAEALILNVDNKRFAALRSWAEEELGHSLDPENNPPDEESIISILLDKALHIENNRVVGSSGKNYEALKDDWATRQQAEPLWIRPDGTVRNGNRRLAMLRRLHTDGSASGGQWVDVIILPYDEIDELELFRMEQEDQLTENFKVRYDKIDLLLALREAALQEDIVWSDPESINTVARALKHIAGRDDRRYAATQLRAIRAIDTYLDYLGASGQYHLVMQERQVEVFREVGRILELGDEYPDDIAELAETAFAAVQIGMKYDGLRNLRKLFRENRESFVALADRIREKERQAGWPPSVTETLASDVESVGVDVLTAEDDDEEDEATAAPGPAAAAYPQAEVKPLIERAVDGVAASTLGTLASLQQAATRLQRITSRELDAALADTQGALVRGALEEVIEWVDLHRERVIGPTNIEPRL